MDTHHLPIGVDDSEEAFDQIADLDYANQLQEYGVRREDRRLMAVVVAGKKVGGQFRAGRSTGQ